MAAAAASTLHGVSDAFDLVDASATLEVDGVEVAVLKVVDQCYLCDMCYMTKCPYVPRIPGTWIPAH